MNISQLPSAYTQLMVAVDFAVGPSYEVVVVGGSQADDTKKMIEAVRGPFIPNKIVILRATDIEFPPIDDIVKFTDHYSSIDSKATAYVCHNYNCQLPTTDINIMLGLLNSEKRQSNS